MHKGPGVRTVKKQKVLGGGEADWPYTHFSSHLDIKVSGIVTTLIWEATGLRTAAGLLKVSVAGRWIPAVNESFRNIPSPGKGKLWLSREC